MAASNPKYKSLDDILSALKDEDQTSEEKTSDDLPKKFPVEDPVDQEKDSDSKVADSDDDEFASDNLKKPTTEEISKIADELDKEDEEEDEDEEEEDDDDDEDAEEDEPTEVSETVEIEEKIDKPKSTWRTSPANLKNSDLASAKEQPSFASDDSEESSLPESMRDERPNFSVPTPKAAAEQRWADFPEYPVSNEPKEEPLSTETPAFESNLSDIVENDRETHSSEPDGFPIRRIDHTTNRFGQHRQEGRFSRNESTLEREDLAEDRGQFGPTKSRSFDYNLNSSGKSRKWQYLIIGLVALITVAAIIFLLKNQYIPFIGSPSTVVISSPSPSPSPTPSPTPTPIPDLDRSGFRIRVLNGTTTSGLASSVGDKLKALGFVIDRVGNNSTQNIEQTTIRVKPNNASLSAQLVRDLTGQFEATAGTALRTTDTYDAEVIIGAK